jgi:hypothetical protein
MVFDKQATLKMHADYALDERPFRALTFVKIRFLLEIERGK